MRLKNLNLFEKYVEKAVLGMGILYALMVMWFYVLGSPHAVELRALSGTFTPGQIEDAILEQANDLDSRISSRVSPFGEAVLEVPPYTDEFRGRLTRPLIPVDTFVTYFGRPGTNIVLSTNIVKPFYVPKPPAPTGLIWDTGFGVLAEPVVSDITTQFEKIIGPQKPRDFRWVSVSAQFDMKKWRELLSTEAPDGVLSPPKNWWRDRLIVTDVILQRQVQNAATGAWGEIETLPAVPGNDRFDFLNNTKFSFRSERVNWAPPEADAALAIASIEQKRLPRPLFPELNEGLWLPPDANDKTMAPALVEQVQALVKQIEDTQKQIKDLKQRMADGTAPATPAAPQPRQPGEIPDGTIAPVMMDLPALEARRTKLREELYVLIGIIEPVNEPARDAVDKRKSGVLAPRPTTIAEVREEEEFSTPDTLRVWQHDISVKDGQSIRYRMIVKVLSPLFFRTRLPKEQQEEYFQKLTLVSEPSAWTEPVQILNEHHFFLSGASKATQVTTIEVFCIFNGQWQRREFDIKPGDPIGQVVQFQLDGETKNVNMNVGGVVVDIDFDAPSAESPNKRTTRLIYFDGKTNTLQTRTLEQDQADPKRDELRKNLKAGS